MTKLYIYINGQEVGQYISTKTGAQELRYSDSWLNDESATPLSLSLPLTEKVHKGNSVYNYFDNLLPDSLDMRNRIQSRFGAKTNRPFDLLYYIGRDCVGAIQLMTEQTLMQTKKISGTTLSEADIANELRNYKTLPLGMSKEQDFRISIAGAQEKTALLRHQKKWQRPTKTTPTTHIFKLPIGKIEHSGLDLSDSVENEWLCLEILRAFNLSVPEISIETFEDIKVLVVKRFDRSLSKDKSWIIRHPVEDLCQANGLPSALKYESDGGPGITQIMKLLQYSLNPKNDRKKFMQVNFLFALLGAIDGHAKNFSIFLKKQGRFELTPFYDVISAYPLAAKKQIAYKKMNMAMALHSTNTHYRWNEIMPRHWYAQATKDGFPETEMQEIIEETVANLEGVISKVSSLLPASFPNNIAEPIFSGMQSFINKY
jgi:serine/threonine-protein kinase HipA